MKTEELEKAEAEIVELLNKEAEAQKAHKGDAHKDENRYRIFRLEKDSKTGKNKKITMKKFWAKSDAEAYEELKDYKKIANKQYVYYYGAAETYSDIVKDPVTGEKKIKRYDSIEEMFADEDRRRPLLKKIKDEVEFWIEMRIDFFRDIKYWFKDIVYWFKTKHNRNECWSLDIHILDDILHNIPLIIEDKHGVPNPFVDMAVKELYGETDDVKYSQEEKVFELAKKKWNAELEKLLLYTRLYVFYRDFGIVEDKDEAMKKIEAEYAKTLPYKPGTYKEFDYKKLEDLQHKNWNSIWNWIKQYGEMLWN